MKAPRKLLVPIAYVDEMNAIDSRMRILIALCKCCDEPEPLTSVGSLFQDLLDRKNAVEHFFLGIEIDPDVAGERTDAEVYYLEARYPDLLKRTK